MLSSLTHASTTAAAHFLQIIMRYSSYQHVNRDRLFFEGLYITIINICDDAFQALGKRSEIELFLGELFRGRHFNLCDAP